MGSKTVFEIISSTQDAPSVLKTLSEEFISIETKHNDSIRRLNDEEAEIKTTYNNSISFLKNQCNQKILDIENGYSGGSYVSKVLAVKVQEWESKVTTAKVFQWVSVAFGVLLIFGLGKWLVGLAVGGLSFWLIGLVVEKIQGTKNIISHFVGRSSYSEKEQSEIIHINSNITAAIDAQAKIERRTMDTSKNSLKTELANNLEKKDLDYKEIISEFKGKEQRTLFELRKSTKANIEKVKSQLNSLVGDLNKLPESYNNNQLNWKNEDILKGKESVSSYFRIGVDAIKIKIDETAHVFEVPHCIPFLNKSNISFSCNNQNETKEAVRISHNIIGRTLLSLPASKTKITFIDPLELGGNAAPYTPLLREIYGGMVFTQQNDIENQLLSLTRAIENVIQRYLQNKFADIAQYNIETKEVPEPYRLLVVYNFPHGFNDTTANKLLNIIKSGPKAGVHTILINDKSAKLPYGMDWNVFEGINIKDVPLVISNTINRQFKFDQDLPYNEIVKYINIEFPNTNTLKVPFTKYIDPQSKWWLGQSHKSFEVPIGRHAVDIQNLIFNNALENQALLIGKPGSGKSNLLHVIIINALWKYSPDQLEIYLIDFKEGVEFAIYADKKIPHIRALAIESEREFGESVLLKIFNMLEERGNLCTKAGVDNIENYNEKCLRENTPDKIMPRVLLIVDEFHVFFSEEDALADRVQNMFATIIQKGRAYGLNTLFSSQTLSMRTMKRQIIGLINIRISLMCSDDDALIILDDNNPAAKDLKRPGEGIYNEKGGKKGENNIFQAFFIDKDDLTKTIDSIAEFSIVNKNQQKNYKQIVFRGSELARMQKEGHPMEKIIPISSPRSLRLWVGEPVAIAEDVTAILRKQGGSNLIVAGYDENIGVKVMCSSIISIAAQQKPNTCKFYSFNFYNVDSELVDIPTDLYKCIQQDCKNIINRDVKETLESIKSEIEKRLSGNSTDNSNIFLTFFSLQRGRVFRKEGYSMSDEGNLLAYILKEGADVGVYSLVQVDTMDNFSKNLDDNLIKEFSQRVASQMNPDNSVKLIGNQKASNLGNNRAWYYDDNENTMIKFKPYELPVYTWVAQLQKEQSTLS